MLLWNRLWRDESGVVLSAEAVMVGSVATVGVVAGVSSIGHALDGELREIGYAIRSMDQSYVYNGHVSPAAWTAGSSYIQPSVELAHADLGARVDAGVKAYEERLKSYQQKTDTPADEEKKPARKRKMKKKTVEIDETPTPAAPNDLPSQTGAQ